MRIFKAVGLLALLGIAPQRGHLSVRAKRPPGNCMRRSGSGLPRSNIPVAGHRPRSHLATASAGKSGEEI